MINNRNNKEQFIEFKDNRGNKMITNNNIIEVV